MSDGSGGVKLFAGALAAPPARVRLTPRVLAQGKLTDIRLQGLTASWSDPAGPHSAVLRRG